MQKYLTLIVLVVLIFSCGSPIPEDLKVVYNDLPEKVDFNFHIRPILADRCFSCHGPDDNSREAGFRLDIESFAFAKLKDSNRPAIVKGSLDQSTLWHRIISEYSEMQMPPPESNLKLNQEEKALIAKWIRQGAQWKDHWAFIPPKQPTIPSIDQSWLDEHSVSIRNPIDNFILDKVKSEGLLPSSEADKTRLIRRLSFDLTGLPPSIEEIDRFLADKGPDAYEQLVGRLIDTEAYAERMTMDWMDVARFADSHGMHADGMREMWPYRDWVIEAFRKNLSYKDFVTWQLAGDLIPNATKEQRLATAFQRNQVMSAESGIVSEEYRLKYVSERANTTATAFMGLTMECATCHDHKFDPVSQKEYYEMTAFFNNMKELGMIGNDKNFGPLMLLPDAVTEDRIDNLTASIDSLTKVKKLAKKEIEDIGDFISKIESKPLTLPQPDGLYPFDHFKKKKRKNGGFNFIIDRNENSTAIGEPELVEGKIGNAIRINKDNDQLFLAKMGYFNLQESFSANTWIKTEKADGFQSIMGNVSDKNTGWRGWIFYLDSLRRPSVKIIHSHSHNYLHVQSPIAINVNQWTNVCFTYDGSATAAGIKLYVDGKSVTSTIYHDNLYKSILPLRTRSYLPHLDSKIRLGIGRNYLFTDTDNAAFVGSYDQIRLFNQVISPIEVAAFYQTDLETSSIKIKHDEQEYLAHHLIRNDQRFQDWNQELKQLRNEKYALLDDVQEVMVQDESMPRKTHILDRGRYDALGEEVFPNTPAAILEFSDELPKNRLGLAQWLFDEEHPLTARVAVNRYWQMIFGRGIVDTPHDFGIQGSLPSHPELLDWLATEFRATDWNVQELLTLMVTSATYRQSSIATDLQMSKDADNIYLSRGASYRLQAEMIRDNSLAASGLLSKKIGGASVKPYQPEGLWKEKNEFSGFINNYIEDTGDSLYRRSMYTFIRRTSPPPSMITFDAPQRDVCIMKREKTNTPLQALVLLNDPQFVEASRVLAERMQKEGGDNMETQTQYAFRLLCGRNPTEQELQLLKEQYDVALIKYQKEPAAAEQLLQVGEYPYDENLDKVETAALALLANTIMNFDEAYMRR